MPKCGNILLVSDNFELHHVLQILASTYNFSLLGAETAKEGFSLFNLAKPDCMIFDLQLLPDPSRIECLKTKLGSCGVPVLFLSDSRANGTAFAQQRSSIKLEPVVRFIAEQSDRLRAISSASPLQRFFGRLRLGFAKPSRSA